MGASKGPCWVLFCEYSFLRHAAYLIFLLGPKNMPKLNVFSETRAYFSWLFSSFRDSRLILPKKSGPELAHSFLTM